jgi:DNA-binding CsgD family transcriptional regulator
MQLVEPETVLGRLSDKQRQVLDMIVERRTSKEIARSLGISASAVEQRLQSARKVLNASSRDDAARAYALLITPCNQLTGDPSQVPAIPFISHLPSPEVPDAGAYTLADSGHIHWDAPWSSPLPTRTSLEKLDQQYGVWWRIASIVGLCMTTALVVLIGLAVAAAIDRLM